MRAFGDLSLRLVAIVSVVLLSAPCLRADQPNEDSAARRQLADKGTRKITFGMVLLAAGAFVVRLRASPRGGTDPDRSSGYR